jgi:hypothetical protein
MKHSLYDLDILSVARFLWMKCVSISHRIVLLDKYCPGTLYSTTVLYFTKRLSTSWTWQDSCSMLVPVFSSSKSAHVVQRYSITFKTASCTIYSITAFQPSMTEEADLLDWHHTCTGCNLVCIQVLPSVFPFLKSPGFIPMVHRNHCYFFLSLHLITETGPEYCAIS